MPITNAWRVVSATILVATVGCSKNEETSAAVSTQTVAVASQESASKSPPAACVMVTAAEMSSIVGTAVAAAGESGGGSTTCRYQPASKSSPYVEVKVDWGGGAAAMTSAGILSRLEPGISNRLAGLGDQASAMGPALMIRTGDDLVNLTLWGVNDDVAAARRIIDTMRPRMGASAQAKAGGASGSDSASTDADDDLAKAGQFVSGLLKGLAAENERSRKTDPLGAAAAADTSAPVDEATFERFAGTPIRVPLVAGLTLVGAEHEPRRGDYEPIVTVSGVSGEQVSTVFSANLPEGTKLSVDRAVRREDLRQARGFRPWYESGDPRIFAGVTSFSVSAAVLSDLRAKGQADVVRMHPDANPLAAIANLLSDTASDTRHPGTLQRLEPHDIAFPVLLNDEPVHLPAIHARGTFDDATIDFCVLNDPDNPILLRVAGKSVGRIVRIAFPTPVAAPIEEKLKKDARVVLHGIYFDFGKDSLRPESEPVLRDIATALTHNPAWTIGIEGHTDNIGGDSYNLDLSRRRAAAVKSALIARYGIAATRLSTEGYGAGRPKESNDTLSGRARNRRVELVRQ